MSRSHFSLVVTLCLAISVAVIQPAFSQFSARQIALAKPADKTTCCTYHLGDLADDPNFGKWIADTIPDVIQPGSWNQPDRVIRCYAPARILVVMHTPGVQTEVDAFLKSLKATMPQTKEKTASLLAKSTNPYSNLVQTQFLTPNVLKTPEPAGAKPYPVPAAAVQPKHLFHFIIRYEGDGLIDASVADLLVKAINGDSSVPDEKSAKAQAEAKKSLGQLFHVIMRYEGEGLIDSTVAGVIKNFYDLNMLGQAGPPNAELPMPEPPPPPPSAAPRSPKKTEPKAPTPSPAAAPPAPGTRTLPQTPPIEPVKPSAKLTTQTSAAQWSEYGVLRPTDQKRDGQPVYVLEDNGGQPLLYVTAPGLRLQDFAGRTISLYGSVNYQADELPRNHCMKVTHVALP